MTIDVLPRGEHEGTCPTCIGRAKVYPTEDGCGHVYCNEDDCGLAHRDVANVARFVESGDGR